MRLSRDDERAGESLSIENQRAILTEYVSKQGWTVYDEYVDDGVSGVSFDRPGVQRLLDDAKNGKYQSPTAAYGYIKSDDEKHTPIIDSEAAGYQMKINQQRGNAP